jgi:hypothetical protein
VRECARYLRGQQENCICPKSAEDNGVVTQITTVKVQADNQSEVLELMKERAPASWASQPGFVSVSLHPQRRRQPCRELCPVEGTASS